MIYLYSLSPGWQLFTTLLTALFGQFLSLHVSLFDSGIDVVMSIP